MNNLRQKLILIFIISLSLCLPGCFGNYVDYLLDDPPPNYNRHKSYRAKHKRPKQKNYSSRTVNNEDQSLQAEVFRLVNMERSREGLPPLKSLPVLKEIAQVRAEELPGRFEHRRPSGESWESILSEYGIRWRFCAENIAMGQESPQAVMRSWMNSSGHRQNILSHEAKYLGVGVVRANGRLWWSQNFLTPR